jgi:hypothetical protein
LHCQAISALRQGGEFAQSREITETHEGVSHTFSGSVSMQKLSIAHPYHRRSHWK